MSEHSRASERAGILAVTLTAFLWGTSGTAAALAPALSAVTIGAIAMSGGGLLQGAINARAVRAAWPSLMQRWPTVLAGGVCVAIYPLCFYGSMRVGGVALGTVVSLASAPLFSAVIERFAEGRALTTRWSVACALGIAGSVALALSRSESSHGDSVSGSTASAWGVVLGLGAGATYAGFSWAMRRLMNEGLARGASAGGVMGLGGVLLLPVVAVCVPSVIEHPESLVVLAYLVVVPQFLGYVLFSRGLRRIDSSTATTITLIEPAVATVLAVVVLSESITAVGWMGIGVLAVALVVLMAPARRRRSVSVEQRSSHSGTPAVDEEDMHEAVPRGRRGT
ncbi:DMT family transporter [Gordonia alkanivorans]|uniref:Permease n=1 Tax=Gordonia alkanivorans CGMCC 6845 TaxID=1423140 RepID=W9DAV7_9ACTN|nr:DMT family transporter [Gordonia alkanivorans]ETA06533.1 permease [Gordonia alkanivorans CGMCC 6845]MDH3010046.1 DMT family transporter [Gordonia alkanivorans]